MKFGILEPAHNIRKLARPSTSNKTAIHGHSQYRTNANLEIALDILSSDQGFSALLLKGVSFYKPPFQGYTRAIVDSTTPFLP